MKTLFFSLYLIFSIFTLNAQLIRKPTNLDDKVIFTSVERMPRYPGGETAMLKFIQENIKLPYTVAVTEGKAYVKFTIDPEGNLWNITSLRQPDNELSAEAIRVISIMPPWIPAKHNGYKVYVYYTIPIDFTKY